VVVGAGFAGFNAARELSRLAGTTTEVVVINSTDYFLYLPLMPQVAGGARGTGPHQGLAALPVGQSPVRARHGDPRRPPGEEVCLARPGEILTNGQCY
jgi:NADPH-dependent 2,4-dienoyl-CoA reductase/sulfur reductase-like enzyme